MKYTKEEVEERLKEVLEDLLRAFNQEDGLISLTVDEGMETCTVKLSVTIVEDDNYIGFSGY